MRERDQTCLGPLDVFGASCQNVLWLIYKTLTHQRTRNVHVQLIRRVPRQQYNNIDVWVSNNIWKDVDILS